jgi:hypothetical protein
MLDGNGPIEIEILPAALRCLPVLVSVDPRAAHAPPGPR